MQLTKVRREWCTAAGEWVQVFYLAGRFAFNFVQICLLVPYSTMRPWGVRQPYSYGVKHGFQSIAKENTTCDTF